MTGPLPGLALVAVVTVVFWSAPALARPTLPFGVRVPEGRTGEPAITRTRRRYGDRVAVLGAVAAVAVVLLGRPRLVVLALVGCCCVVAHHAHRSVAAAKRDGNWYHGLRQSVTTDTSLRTDPVRPQWALLAPAVVVLVTTAGIGSRRYDDLPPTLPTPGGVVVDATRRTATTFGHAFGTVTAQVVVILLAAVLAVAIPRTRPDLDAARPAASAARYRTYLTGVPRLLFVSATCATTSLLVVSLQVWEILPTTLVVTLVGYLPLAAAAAAWLRFAVGTGDAGHRLPAEPDQGSGHTHRDDDRHWHLAGTVYANRDDPAVLVHRRSGTFWTLNLGHPVSWAVLTAVATLAALTALGVVHLPGRSG